MSSRSSATPPPQIVKKKSSKKERKQKIVAGEPKNEGQPANWDYKPPHGATLLENDTDVGEFDWDAVKDDDDTELWLIRIPEGIKPRYLQNLEVDVPSSPSSSCIGSLKRKDVTYDIWNMGGDGNAPVGGEELKDIDCLLPRKKKKGKLYPAPKPFARRLVMVAQRPQPQTPEGDDLHQNAPRFAYPEEVLRHRFLPYGSLEKSPNNVEDAEIADLPAHTTKPKSPKQSRRAGKPTSAEEPPSPSKATLPSEEVPKKAKSKKRKGEPQGTEEAPAPKKQKKSKAPV